MGEPFQLHELEEHSMKSCTRILKRIAILGLPLLLLSACGGGARPFVPMQKGLTFKPASLAIICAQPDEAGEYFSTMLTDELRKNSTFEVLTQQQVGKKLKKYPFTIKMADLPEKTRSPNWLEAKERKTLTTLAKKLNVDYLFVVWPHDLGRTSRRGPYGSSEYYSMAVHGNMFAFPEGNAVTFTDYNYYWELSFVDKLKFKEPSYYVKLLLEGSAKFLGEQFVKTTGAKKKT